MIHMGGRHCVTNKKLAITHGLLAAHHIYMDNCIGLKLVVMMISLSYNHQTDCIQIKHAIHTQDRDESMAEKIFIVGPAWVGDMVMSQSLYITLKQHNPDADISVLAPAWCLPLLNRMKEVNRAIEMPIGHGELNLLGRRALGKVLQADKYTHAYILPNSAKSALIPWFAGIPKRTGWKGEMRYGLLNDLRHNKKAIQHMVARYVALAHRPQTLADHPEYLKLDNIPVPQLTVVPQQQARLLSQHQIDANRPCIGLCPGAEFGPAKQWPAPYYAEVAKQLIERGYQVLLFGSEKDRETTRSIELAIQPFSDQLFNLAGQTSLIEALDLIGYCQTIICNDSGLMHVAAAVGCEVITLYGSSSFEYTPPLTERKHLLYTDIECRPCFKRTCPLGHLNCLQQLLPEQVLSLIPDKAPL